MTCPVHDETNEPECEACEAECDADRRYWLRQWNGSTLQERDPKAYAAALVGAGRGHLLCDDEADDVARRPS